MSGSASESWRTTASRSGPIDNDRAPVPETSPPVETTLMQRRPAGHTSVSSGIVAPGLPLPSASHTAVPSGIVARGGGAHAAGMRRGDAQQRRAGEDAAEFDELLDLIERTRLGDQSPGRGHEATELSEQDREWLEELDEYRSARDELEELEQPVASIEPAIHELIDRLGVRAGTPGAETKRRLIEARGNLPPETLAMLRHFASSSAAQDAQRRQRGLKDPRATAQFANEMRGLHGSWPAMPPAERADAIGRRINARLRDIGVPELKIKAVAMAGSANGQFNYLDWSIQINVGTLHAPRLAVHEFGSLTQTAYHEARHAEQWYLIARALAERGSSPAAIAKKTRIPSAVCEAAAIAPPLSRAQMDAATVFYESVYGERMKYRNHVLNEHARLEQRLAAGPTVAAIEAAPNLSAAEKWQHAQAVRQLQGLEHQYYQAYKDLPEEHDAWAVGDAAEKAFHAPDPQAAAPASFSRAPGPSSGDPRRH